MSHLSLLQDLSETAKVMIVDDDSAMRKVLRAVLEQDGYVIQECASGVEGLACFYSFCPDVVLLDAVMPEMDGFSCCTELCTYMEHRSIPILMVTALEDSASIDRAFKVGASDYITKPIQWTILRKRLARLIQMSQAMQNLQDINLELEQKVKEQTKQLSDQVEELRRLDCLKDNFLSTISHELRTPLSNIKVATEMLHRIQMKIVLKEESEFKPEIVKMRQYLDILQQEIDREVVLINNVLDLKRTESTQSDIVYTWTDLSYWIPNIIKPFTLRAELNKQILHVTIPSYLPLIQSDPSCIEKVLSELLNNACKYTPSGENIFVSAGQTDHYCYLRVKNTGVEIAETEVSHLFEQFYRVPSRNPWSQAGTGLGLALAKKRVNQLGGSIEVDYSPGQITFTVYLPLPPEVKSIIPQALVS